MGKGILIKTAVLAGMLCGVAIPASSESFNVWRGNEIKANWNNAYKWKLKHAPTGSEAVHFLQANSVVSITDTIELGNGIKLYGQELSFEGNGSINLPNPLPQNSTVYIPASTAGSANLILNDTLALNGQIALATKALGKSASKGSVTLNNQSSITGNLLIGNNGNGSGTVFIRDQSTYRISGLELNTKADMGGSAEIHILGGTAEIETKSDPFAAFLDDPSRKIVLGNGGTLIIHSGRPTMQINHAIAQMVAQHRLVADSGCKLTPPVIQNSRVLIRGESIETSNKLEELLANISHSDANKAQPAINPEKINILVDSLKQKQNKTPPPAPTVVAAAGVEPRPAAPSPAEPIAQTPAPKHPVIGNDQPPPPLAGYIAFFSAVLLMLRPAKSGQ